MSILIIAIAIVAGLFLCEWICVARHRGIETARALRDAFFACATELLRDPRTPDSVVLLLEACANTITRTDVGRLVIRRALAGRLPSASLDDPQDEDSEILLNDVHAMPGELRHTLAQAAMYYAQAVSFNNTVLGGLVRRLSALWLAGPAKGGKDALAGRPVENRMVDVTPPMIKRDRLAANS
jgi:hypothetical protein